MTLPILVAIAAIVLALYRTDPKVRARLCSRRRIRAIKAQRAELRAAFARGRRAANRRTA